jgi:hypothetical protein
MTPPAGSELPPTGITEHERELARRIAPFAPEHELADWATTNLAVALHAAEGEPTPAEDPARVLRRALLVSSARIFRLARAGMATLAAGYKAEARILDRALWETRARCIQAVEDPSGETAHKLLAGKLDQRISAAVRATVPTDDPEMATRLYRDLSGDAHPDLRQFMTRLIRETPTGGYEMGFSPHRSQASRQSLFLYAWFAGEATERIGLDVGIPLPHHGALADRLIAAAANLKAQFGRTADPPGDVEV